MKVIADISIVPLGVGISVSKYIAECQKIFRQAGVKHSMHAYGTNLEGEWDEVFKIVKQCHEVLHKMGAPRVSSNMRFGTRTDKEQTMQDKIDSVNKKLNEH